MKIGILTSGGDAPGMNAAIRSACRVAIHYGMEVYGINRGYDGLIDADIEKLESYSVASILDRGGTVLQTARSPRFMTEEGFSKALSVISLFGLDAIICIGGDGTMRGAMDLVNAGVNVIFIPGTIDNDVAYTDFTIGFDTAVATVIDAVGKIRDTSSAHDRTMVIEVMGRHCPDIAIHAGLAAGAEKILVPGIPFDMNELCKDIIIAQQKNKKHYIIIKAEGFDYDCIQLAKDIEAKTGLDTKAAILSYIQRGGSPTANDRNRGSMMGAKAVELIKDGLANKAIGLVGGAIESFPIEEAASQPRVNDYSLLELAEIIG